jgi:hypothetical protein
MGRSQELKIRQIRGPDRLIVGPNGGTSSLNNGANMESAWTSRLLIFAGGL